MEKEKADAYVRLVRTVKEKYTTGKCSPGKLKLSWCDLVPGEDLCREINLWTYWQGFDYAKKTPHIRYMLIGQDFGPPEREALKGTIWNVRKMNDGQNVMFHDGVKMDSRDSYTDRELTRFFRFLGYDDIEHRKFDDLFFTNCCLGYRTGNYSGNMTVKQLSDDTNMLKALIDLMQPDNVICLGKNTAVTVLRTLVDRYFKGKNVSEIIGDGTPYQYGCIRVFPVAHPGYWGMRARGREQADKDWKRIAEWNNRR